MRIIHDLNFTREQFSSPALTIGSYDGLHVGHQEIIRRVLDRARSWRGESMVLTFEPHPVRVLYPQLNIPLITPYRKKIMLLERLGIDVTINLPFTKSVYEMSAEEFVQEIVHKRIAPRAVVVGFNFTFGKDKEGTAEALKGMGERLGFEVGIVPPYTLDQEVVSSTRIRALILQGRIKDANRMLGRNFIIMGKVVHGHSRGKELGYPTANLEVTQDLYPKKGVYAAYVTLGEETHSAAVSIGTKPTFGDEELAIEVFLLDYQGDLYGRELKVDLVDRLRDEKAFPSSEALVRQIEKDIQRAKEILQGK